MTEPLEQIAEALDVKLELNRLATQMAQLNTVVSASLGEQRRLNSAIESRVNKLEEKRQVDAERLVKLEAAQKSCRLPALEERLQKHEDTVAALDKRFAKYIGMGMAACTIIGALISYAVKIWG